MISEESSKKFERLKSPETSTVMIDYPCKTHHIKKVLKLFVIIVYFYLMDEFLYS